jgi:hypothetical protein
MMVTGVQTQKNKIILTALRRAIQIKKIEIPVFRRFTLSWVHRHLHHGTIALTGSLCCERDSHNAQTFN